jgi:type II secretory pathway pseudopilin PulG
VIRRLGAWWPRNRRQAQSGATLVELLVSVVIMGMALTLIIGTFSTGLLDATLAKRDTAALAVVQYELDQISGRPYNSSAQAYSDCFATEATSAPTPANSYRGTCPDSTYTLRADVSPQQPAPGPNVQMWSIAVVSWPNGAQVSGPIQIVKGNR